MYFQLETILSLIQFNHSIYFSPLHRDVHKNKHHPMRSKSNIIKLYSTNKCIYCVSDQGLSCPFDFNLTISKALTSTYSLIVEKLRKDKWKEDENSLRNFRPKNGWGLCNLNITEAWHRPAQLGEIPFVFLFLRLLKFRYCEKATRFEKIFNLFFEIT